MNSPAPEFSEFGISQKLKDHRTTAGYSIEESANFIECEPELMSRYESGEAIPSLVELETLAYYFKVVPETFWQGEDDITPEGSHQAINFSSIANIRMRTIGLSCRKFRMEAGLDREQMAGRLEISVETLDNYELGAEKIPIDKLYIFAEQTNHSLNDFLDRKSPIGIWAETQRINQEILSLPIDIKDFIAKPINYPYLQIAQKLSKMPVKELRKIAEGLLEITL